MQRFASLYTGASRLLQVSGIHHGKNSHVLFNELNSRSNGNLRTFERCLATKSANQKNADSHSDLYKPSTAKEGTHVPDDLKGGQPADTIETGSKSSSTAGGKVWSTQSPSNLHIAPLNEARSAASAPFDNDKQAAHETTVYSTKGKLNIADPFKTHPLQPEPSPAQLAEAAAASAFQPFAPDTPLDSAPANEPVFAPKISSKDIHSTATSPTAHFEATVSASTTQEPVKYEMASKPKVFGGQDTSADARKHPKENPFNTKEKLRIDQQGK